MTAPTTAPPAVLPPNPAGIPAKLAARREFVAWDWEWRPNKDGTGGKWTKPPYNPRTRGKARSDDRSTWGSIDEALAAMERFGLPGIGIAFAQLPDGRRRFGIDLDGCRVPATGEITPWALAIVSRFPRCYVEPSATGTGIHITGTTRGVPNEGTGNKCGPVECYWSGRYFTITGYPLPGYDDPDTDATEALLAWHPEAFPPPAATEASPLPPPDLTLDDEQILANARRMPRFREFWEGGGTEDHSAGDLTMMNELIAAGSTDPGQLDRLMRASGRYRPKWDARRGQMTYGERTITKALNGVVVPFEGFLPKPPPPPRRDFVDNGHDVGAPEIGLGIGNPQDAATGADGLPDDSATLKQIILTLTRALDEQRVRAEEQRARADNLEQRLVLLGEVQSRSAAINRNRDLGAARTTANAVVNFLASKAAAGTIGPDGMVEARLAGERGLAEAAGVSSDTASKHLEQLAEVVPLRKETRWIPDSVDTATGMVRPGHKMTYIGLRDGATVVDLAAALAAARPTKPRNWGGRRIACPDHPDAGTVKRWSLHCAECGQVLDRGEETLAPADAPENRMDMRNPQDAATGEAPDRGPSPSVAPVLLSRSDATSHNDDPPEWDERTSRARADLRARRVGSPNGEPMTGEHRPGSPPPQPARVPLFEPPPGDRWTG